MVITTSQQVRELAEQIRGTKMRKVYYELGPLLLTAFDNEIHAIAGYSRFEDWYMKEFNERSCPRALWDILKIERVRVVLGVPSSFFEPVDISKAKKIAQLCERDGRVSRGHKPKDIVELFRLARTASLKEIEVRVNALLGKRPHIRPWDLALASAEASFPGLNGEELKDKIGEVYCLWANSESEQSG